MKILKKSNNPNVGFNISQSALGRFQDCRQKARYALDGWVAKQPSRPLFDAFLCHDGRGIQQCRHNPEAARGLAHKPVQHHH